MIEKNLRVSVPSVEALASCLARVRHRGLALGGPANSPTFTDAQFAVLEEELGKGRPAHGFDDERWTLAQVQSVIRRRLRVSLSVATVCRLLKRHVWYGHATALRPLERDEHAVELWQKEVRPQVKASRRRVGAGSSSRTRSDSP
ncbi:winged helix-turn-helix domain-containing protein [Streptomyces vinaceus]|uniref:winged helix-turn-helix domain-containing protein n=1 Tax=Streptomyces vinaceus TaxID=1960 RepID=UPI0035DB97CF